MYPAGQEEYLKDRHGNLPFDVTAPTLQDRSLYPRYHQSQPPVEIVQEAGEIVFIPSGWHHQVYNLVREAVPAFSAHGGVKQAAGLTQVGEKGHRQLAGGHSW